MTPAQCLARQIERVTIRVLDTLHQTDELYRRDAQIGRKLRLAAAGVHVQTTAGGSNLPNMKNYNPDQVLDAYKKWLAKGTKPPDQASWKTTQRGPGLPAAIDSCLNHLFTHTDFNTGTLGVASTPGLCAERIWYDCGGGRLSSRASGCGNTASIGNAGFTTTLSRARVVPHWQSVAVMTHELGHNFGSAHDCCTSCYQSELQDGSQIICPGYKTAGFSYDAKAPRAKSQ